MYERPFFRCAFSGSFAVVRKGIRKKDGEVFALKIIKKKNLNAEELATMNDEVHIMKRVRLISEIFVMYRSNGFFCVSPLAFDAIGSRVDQYVKFKPQN